MQIASVIAQLRTTDLAASIRFYKQDLRFVLELQYQDFYAGIRAGTEVFHLKLVDTMDPSIKFVDQGGTSISTSGRTISRRWPRRSRSGGCAS
jgi:hypothetical protein